MILSDVRKRFWGVGRGLFVVGVILLVGGCGRGSKPEEIWGETGVGSGQLVYPRGIAYSKKLDCFYVVDRTAHVQRWDMHGKCLNEWHMPESVQGKPVGISVGPDGNVYVPDTHYARVMVFSPEGKRLREWGKLGRGPGEFIYPTDVAFDSAGLCYVSEYGDNDRVQVFDLSGPKVRVVRAFGTFGQKPGEFARPQSMVIDGEVMYITDASNHRIQVFKTDGTFMRTMCGVGSGLGQLRFPYGLDQDGEGHLIVTEFGNNRVQMIDKETGRGIKAWGKAGREAGELAYPWAGVVDKRGRVVAVDSGNNRVQVFWF